MSDPAVEAAERAAVTAECTGRGLVIAAAREALAPIRELHVPDCGCGDDHVRFHIGPDCDPVCLDCGQLFPCATARLVYTTYELENR